MRRPTPVGTSRTTFPMLAWVSTTVFFLNGEIQLKLAYGIDRLWIGTPPHVAGGYRKYYCKQCRNRRWKLRSSPPRRTRDPTDGQASPSKQKRKPKVSPLLWPKRTRGSQISLLLLPGEPGSPELVKSPIVVEVGKAELLLLSSPTPAVGGGFAGQLLPSTRKREEERGSHHRRSPPSSPSTKGEGKKMMPMAAGHAPGEREERRRRLLFWVL
ncbi:uncharacterized protein LOC116026264 [Ipomoea triloba]|uniref:uncharacterized protein LOC116026264 n=1 Tax=Ipomoea triloba TaxID=35885 RepID=UPI00125E53BC|nr:uncharacterized protein LOC116026264 [Ipomoea triloba]